MKLSERLVALGHWESTASGASECIAQARLLEAANEALTKRVTELEEELFKWESLRRLCPPGVL